MLKFFNLRTVINIGIYLLLVFTSDVTSFQCYVCGPQQLGYKHNCDLFNSNPQFYEEECEPGYHGCVMQVQGGVTTRHCEELSINDCKTANSVKYCYCNKNLCNRENMNNLIPSDDEDFDEGSGSNEIEETIIPRVTVVVNNTATTIYPMAILLTAYFLLP